MAKFTDMVQGVVAIDGKVLRRSFDRANGTRRHRSPADGDKTSAHAARVNSTELLPIGYKLQFGDFFKQFHPPVDSADFTKSRVDLPLSAEKHARSWKALFRGKAVVGIKRLPCRRDDGGRSKPPFPSILPRLRRHFRRLWFRLDRGLIRNGLRKGRDGLDDLHGHTTGCGTTSVGAGTASGSVSGGIATSVASVRIASGAAATNSGSAGASTSTGSVGTSNSSGSTSAAPPRSEAIPSFLSFFLFPFSFLDF